MRTRLLVAVLFLALGAATVFAVWASIDEAPWERTASTSSPRRVWLSEEGASLTVCEVARRAFADAESIGEAIMTALEGAGSGEAFDSAWRIYLSVRQERLLALQLIDDACPAPLELTRLVRHHRPAVVRVVGAGGAGPVHSNNCVTGHQPWSFSLQGQRWLNGSPALRRHSLAFETAADKSTGPIKVSVTPQS